MFTLGLRTELQATVPPQIRLPRSAPSSVLEKLKAPAAAGAVAECTWPVNSQNVWTDVSKSIDGTLMHQVHAAMSMHPHIMHMHDDYYDTHRTRVFFCPMAWYTNWQLGTKPRPRQQLAINSSSRQMMPRQDMVVSTSDLTARSKEPMTLPIAGDADACSGHDTCWLLSEHHMCSTNRVRELRARACMLET